MLRWSIYIISLWCVGDLQQAQVRCDEEGVRAVRPLRLRDSPHHLLLQQQALPVR